MAWSFIGATKSYGTFPAWPAGTQEGDLIVASFTMPVAQSLTAASGWTEMHTRIAGATFAHQTFWIKRGASAPSETFTRAVGGSEPSCGLTVYRSGTGSFSALASPVTHNSASGTTGVTASSLTTTGANDLVIGSIASQADGALTNIRCDTNPNGPSNGVAVTTALQTDTMTAYVDGGYSVAFRQSLTVVAGLKSTAGSTGFFRATQGITTQMALALFGFTETAAPVEGITITDPLRYRVYEGASGTASVQINGTVSGTTENVQAQIETTAGSVVVPWTTIATAVTSGSNFSGNITVPKGGWYRTRVRKNVTTTTTALSTQEWGVGYVIGMTGQSLAVQWDSYGMFSGTIDNRAVSFDGTAYVNNTFGIYGGGRVEWGNYFTALLNAPVALVHSALSSTAISTWWNAGKTTAFNNWQAKVNGAGGQLSGFVWWQGNSDASDGNSKASYMASLRDMITQIRTDHGSNCKVFIMGLGRWDQAGGVDSRWEDIRDAHAEVALDTGNNLIQGWAWEQVANDQHLTYNGYLTAGRVLAHSQGAVWGNTSATLTGPKIQSARIISSTVVDLTIQHDKGTDISPSTGITGIELLDGSGTAVTLSSVVRVNGNTVRITTSAPYSGTPSIRVGYGKSPVATNPLRDNSVVTAPLVATLNNVVADLLVGTVTIPVVNVSNAPAASTSIPNVVITTLGGRNQVLALTGQVTDGSGNLIISNAAITTGQDYIVTGWNADGSSGLWAKATAT